MHDAAIVDGAGGAAALSPPWVVIVQRSRSLLPVVLGYRLGYRYVSCSLAVEVAGRQS